MYRRQLDPMLQAAMLKASSKPPGAKFREIEAGLAVRLLSKLENMKPESN